MKRTERTVNVKAWGRLGAKRVVLYEDRDELRFTDGFHDMRMTQARMEAFIPGGDNVCGIRCGDRVRNAGVHLRISVVRSGSAGMWQHKKMCRRKLRADRRSHGE